jgi:hypothetical protein
MEGSRSKRRRKTKRSIPKKKQAGGDGRGDESTLCSMTECTSSETLQKKKKKKNVSNRNHTQRAIFRGVGEREHTQAQPTLMGSQKPQGHFLSLRQRGGVIATCVTEEIETTHREVLNALSGLRVVSSKIDDMQLPANECFGGKKILWKRESFL